MAVADVRLVDARCGADAAEPPQPVRAPHGGRPPFRKSLRDRLVDPEKAGADFVVDQAEGTRRLVEALWSSFLQWAKQPDSPLNSFCVTELPIQIARSAAADVGNLAALPPWTAIRSGLFKVARTQATAYAWEGALAWWRMTARLAGALGNAGLADEARAYSEAGHILVTLGRSDDALKSFRDGLAIDDRLAKADPGNAGWQRNLGVSYERVGFVLVAQGNLPEALKSFREVLVIRDRLAKADPGNAGRQRALSVSYIKVGEVLVAQGNLPEALKFFRDARAIADRLAKADPGNAGRQRALSVSYIKVGEVLVAQGNLPEAMKFFRDARAIADRLAKADPGNAFWQRDVSMSYINVGDVLVAQGNLPEALKSFRDGLAISDRLAKADPGNAGWEYDLGISNERIGNVQMAQGDLAAAFKSHVARRDIISHLAKSDPGNADWQRDLSVSYHQDRRRAGGAGQSARRAEILPRRARNCRPASEGRPRQRRLAARCLFSTIPRGRC